MIKLLITIFFGWCGAHKILEKKYLMFVLYLFTAGLFGIGWIFDIIKCGIELSKSNKPKNTFTKSTKQISKSNEVPKEIYANAYVERKSRKYPNNYIVFDTETTGLHPEVDKIIELSAIKFVDHVKVDEFSYLINPKVKLDSVITKITGLTDNDLKDAPTIKEVLPKFIEWSEGFTLVAHNASYDVKMIACECYRNNIPMFDNKVIDTLNLAKKIFTEDEIPNYKLATIKKHLGMTNKSHRALDDCETCSTIYQLYCNQK